MTGNDPFHGSRTQIFQHPTLDVALIQLSSEISIGGQRGLTAPLYTGSTEASALGPLLCQGFGMFSLSAVDNPLYWDGQGTLRTATMIPSSGDNPLVLTAPNASDQWLGFGDSGGPCFVGVYNRFGHYTTYYVAYVHSQHKPTNTTQPTEDDGTGVDQFLGWAECESSGYWWNFGDNQCEVREP